MEGRSSTAGADVDSDATAAETIVDALRGLVTVLGAVLSSPAGCRVVQDIEVSRSLPAISKAMRILWLGTSLPRWGSKEQALWLSRLLTVNKGSRAGVLSFYGAGVLLVDALATFAEVVFPEVGVPLDGEWVRCLMVVGNVLRGRHWEQLQSWPGDRRCGGGTKLPMLSPDRLPPSVCRSLALDEVKLTKAQAAGLGTAMLLPGSWAIAAGGLGVAMLYHSVRQRLQSGHSQGNLWERIQEDCLRQAHVLLRSKMCPIEVLYESASMGPERVKVCLYSATDPICAIPIDDVGGDGGFLYLAKGECGVLRPKGDADQFNLRVYRPALLDVGLNAGVLVGRGDHLRVVPSACGTKVACFAMDGMAGGQTGGGYDRTGGHGADHIAAADLREVCCVADSCQAACSVSDGGSQSADDHGSGKCDGGHGLSAGDGEGADRGAPESGL